MPKLFLPISSIEKYLKNVLVDNKNPEIFKRINDQLFQLQPLQEVVNSYKNGLQPSQTDNDGKKLFEYLLDAMKERNIDEKTFVSHIAGIIKLVVDFSGFNDSLKNLLQSKNYNVR